MSLLKACFSDNFTSVIQKSLSMMRQEFSKAMVKDIGLNIGKEVSNKLLMQKGITTSFTNGKEQEDIAKLFHGNFKARKNNRYHHQLNDLAYTKFTIDSSAVELANRLYETFFKWVVTTCAAGEIDHHDVVQTLGHFKRVSKKLKDISQEFTRLGDYENAEKVLDKLADLNAFVQQLKHGLSLADIDRMQEERKVTQGTQLWLIEVLCAIALIHLFVFGLAASLYILTYGLAGVLLVSLLLKVAPVMRLTQHNLRTKKELWQTHQFLKDKADEYSTAIQAYQIKAKEKQHVNYKTHLQGQKLRRTGRKPMIPLVR